MAGVGTLRRAGRTRLAVCGLSGLNAEFAERLATEAEADASSSRLRRATSAVRIWCRTTSGWRNRLILAMAGAFLAALLVGVGPPSRHDVAPVGGASVASADEGDCIHNAKFLPFLPGPVDSFVSGKIVAPINALCRGLHYVAQFVRDHVIQPIKDLIWKAFYMATNQCGWRTSIDIEDPNTGLNGLMVHGVETLIGRSETNTTAHTTWSDYGTAGAYWGTYFLNCFDTTQIADFGANFVFTVAKIFALIAIILFQQTFNSKIVDYFF
ncbi:MAG: hypothetical protein ACRDQZ_12075, partial [Mycobacteriales bacterium]